MAGFPFYLANWFALRSLLSPAVTVIHARKLLFVLLFVGVFLSRLVFFWRHGESTIVNIGHLALAR